VDTTVLGLSPDAARDLPYIASMGIYVFEKKVLHDLLDRAPEQTDFGKEVLPASAKDYNVQAYLFKDYWEDIGTIESFYNANLALTSQPDPPFSFYDEKAPIYTRSRYLPPTKLLDSHVIESMVGEGCILKECTVKRSVVGIRSRIETGCVVDNTLLMGADYYESPLERMKTSECGKVPLGVGANTTIRRAIVDKNARIGRNVNNTIYVEDDFASASHAMLTFRGRSWFVEDQGSTNGTYVNGHRIDRPVALSFGDEVAIGRVRMRLDR